jgi:alpha-1,6-mannosyltransferase
LKIVDVSEFYSERGGGIRSHLTTRGLFLCKLGHDHTVVVPGEKDEQVESYASIAPSGAIASAKIVRIQGAPLPYDRTYHLLGRLDKIRERVRAERPDVLEAHSPYLATAGVLAAGRSASRIRTAFWHSDHVGTFVEPRLGRLARGLDPIVRLLLSPFDATFVAGLAQARKLRALGVKNVEHVPFGVDTATFRPGAASEDARRELLGGEPPSTAVLVGVGRFSFEKRWDVVLDAFATVRARRPAVLVLYGDGPERARLERAAPPGVRFAGFVQDRARLAAALASADLLLHGCPYETFGLGVAEAVACGLPVVVPDAGGASESAHPASSRTYRSLDVQDLAAATLELLDRGRAALREQALEAARGARTPEQHVAQVASVYEAMLRAC